MALEPHPNPRPAILGGLVLILGLSAFAFWLQSTNPVEVNEEVVTATPTPTPGNVYTNSTLGYSLTTPTGWTTQKVSGPESPTVDANVLAEQLAESKALGTGIGQYVFGSSQAVIDCVMNNVGSDTTACYNELTGSGAYIMVDLVYSKDTTLDDYFTRTNGASGTGGLVVSDTAIAGKSTVTLVSSTLAACTTCSHFKTYTFFTKDNFQMSVTEMVYADAQATDADKEKLKQQVEAARASLKLL